MAALDLSLSSALPALLEAAPPSGCCPLGSALTKDRAALFPLCGQTFYFGCLFTLIYSCFCICMSDVLVSLSYAQLSLVLVKLQLVEVYTTSGPPSCPHMWVVGGEGSWPKHVLI